MRVWMDRIEGTLHGLFKNNILTQAINHNKYLMPYVYNKYSSLSIWLQQWLRVLKINPLKDSLQWK